VNVAPAPSAADVEFTVDTVAVATGIYVIFNKSGGVISGWTP